MFTKTGDFIQNDVEYDITFGMYAINSTDVRAIMTIDGVEVYNQTITMPDLVTAEVYFGTYVDANCAMTISGTEPRDLSMTPFLKDTANWATKSGATPTFENGSLVITSDASAVMTGYTARTFENKVFSFKYKQTLRDAASAWNAIYLTAGTSIDYPWNNIGVMVVLKNGSIELQFRGAGYMSTKEGVNMFTKTGDFIQNDVEYDITFGMYAINSTDVRAIMTIDGVEVYNQTITMPDLVTAEVYFGTYVDAGCSMTISAPDSTEVTIDPYMEDILNWASSSGSTPKIKDGVLTLATGTSADQVGYNGTTFKNKLMRFKYTQTLPETTNPWGGIYFTVGGSTTAPWSNSGILVVMKPDQVELQFRGASSHEMAVKTGEIIKNGVEYEITFGMYTINATDVRVIMLLDGIELFNEVITDEALVNAETYFGVYATNETTVVVKTIEPVEATEDEYTSMTVDSMIDDAENWKDFKHGNADAATPVIDSTSVTVQGTSGNSLAGYNVAHKNVVYRFKYTQDITNGGYGGFYISLNQANNIPWNTRGVMITSSANYLAIQAFATAYNSTSFISQQDKDNKFESNKEYDIEFGFYDVSDTIVRVVLKVDGEEIFNIPTDNEALRSATGYFGVITSGAAKVTLTKTGEVTPEPPEPSEPSTEPSEPEETYTELTVDAMLADTANWKDFVWASSSSASPTFQNGSMSLKGTATNNLAGYNTAYKNTVYKFKYTHDYTSSGGSGFYINLTTPNNIPWNSCGIRVMSSSKLTLQAWKAATNTNKVIEETNVTDMFVNGVTYEIEFGMYDISETEVRIILRVNGKEIFNVTSAEEVFRSATGYFGVEVSGSAVTATISGVEAAYVAAIGEDKYETLQEAVEAASAGQTIELLQDVTVDTYTTLNIVQGNNGQSGTYEVKAAVVLNGVNLDGNGYTLTVTGLGDKSADGNNTAIWTNGGVISDFTIDGGARGIFYDGNLAANIDLNNVVIENSCRPINVSGGTTATYALNATGCTFAGKISYGEKALTGATFAGCNFTVQSGAKGDVLEPYTNTTLANCTFADGYVLSASDLVAGKKIVKSGTTNAVAPEGYIWDTDGALVRCNVVELDTMLADTANWKDFRGRVSYPISLPVYENGTISLPGKNSEALENFNKDGSVVGYKTAYANTLYKFKYTQTVHTSGSGGFYIGVNEPANIPWNSGGVLVTSGGSLDIQGFVKSSTESGTNFVKQNSTDVLVSGQTYDIEFGMYDIGENAVRVILRVDGKEIYNIVSEGSYFYSKPVYFGIYNKKEATVTVSGMQAVEAV